MLYRLYTIKSTYLCISLSWILYTLSNCSNPNESSSTNISPKPPSSFVNKIHITATYDPTGELITCTLQNKDKQLAITGKYVLQITPHEGTQATTKDVPLQNGKYSIDLGTINLAAGKGLIKTFTIQWDDSLVAEFNFQLMYREGDALAPTGEPITVKCQREPLQLTIEHHESGHIKYTIMNVSNKEVNDIVLCWRCQQPTVQIIAFGNVLQQDSIGTLLGGAQYTHTLGKLDFGGNTQAILEFWLQTAGNTVYSQQRKIFTAPAAFKELPTNLFEAIDMMQVEGFQELLKGPAYQPKILDIEKETGHTLLTKAIETLPPPKRKLFVSVFLQQNELVNLPNITTQMTPLHYAIEKNDTEVSQLLLNVPSIEVASLDAAKRTPIFWAIDKLQSSDLAAEDIIRQLLNKMQQAIGQEKTKEILNTRDTIGYTPLSKAVGRHFSLPIISSLLQAGADPNQVGTNVISPLYGAIHHQDPTLVALLVQYHADVKKANKQGETPLHEVICHATKENIGVMKEIMQILLKHGADINATNKEGKRPIDLVKEEVTNLQTTESEELIQLLQAGQ